MRPEGGIASTYSLLLEQVGALQQDGVIAEM